MTHFLKKVGLIGHVERCRVQSANHQRGGFVNLLENRGRKVFCFPWQRGIFRELRCGLGVYALPQTLPQGEDLPSLNPPFPYTSSLEKPLTGT